MAKYRKKPVVIEAWRVAVLWRINNNFWTLPPPIEKAHDEGTILFLDNPSRIEIKTLEGTMTADFNDLLIQGIQGEFYPCKPDIFANTYEYAEE